jgi:hypothetical protein
MGSRRSIVTGRWHETRFPIALPVSRFDRTWTAGVLPTSTGGQTKNERVQTPTPIGHWWNRRHAPPSFAPFEQV